MKKVILSLTILLAVISLAACSLNSNTGIQFTQLPDAIYEQKVDINENEVNELLGQIKVKVNGTEYALTEKSLKVSGFSVETLRNPGSYTLTVTYDSLSVSYNYTVVAVAAPVVISTQEQLLEAGINGGVYELAKDIEITRNSSLPDLSTSALVIKEDFTLYGNGYKISSGNGRRVVNIANIQNKSVNLYDLSIICSGDTSNQRALQIQYCENINLVLDNVTLDGNPNNKPISSYTLNLFENENLNITIKESYINGWAAINCYANYSTINVMNSTLKGENYFSGNSDNFAVIVIDGGGFDDQEGNGNTLLAGEAGVGNVLNFENCEFIAVAHTENQEFIVSTQYDALLNKVNFNNCKFEYTGDFNRDSGVGNKLYIDGNEK